MPYVKVADARRMAAAEEVCWTLLLMMGFGLLPVEEQAGRDMLADPMMQWADKAVATGLMSPAEDES